MYDEKARPPTRIRDDSVLWNKHERKDIDLQRRWYETKQTYDEEQDLLFMSSPRRVLILTDIVEKMLSVQENAVIPSFMIFFLMFLHNPNLALLFVCLLIPAFIMVHWQQSAQKVDQQLQKRDLILRKERNEDKSEESDEEKNEDKSEESDEENEDG